METKDKEYAVAYLSPGLGAVGRVYEYDSPYDCEEQCEVNAGLGCGTSWIPVVVRAPAAEIEPGHHGDLWISPSGVAYAARLDGGSL